MTPAAIPPFAPVERLLLLSIDVGLEFVGEVDVAMGDVDALPDLSVEEREVGVVEGVGVTICVLRSANVVANSWPRPSMDVIFMRGPSIPACKSLSYVSLKKHSYGYRPVRFISLFNLFHQGLYSLVPESLTENSFPFRASGQLTYRWSGGLTHTCT